MVVDDLFHSLFFPLLSGIPDRDKSHGIITVYFFFFRQEGTQKWHQKTKDLQIPINERGKFFFLTRKID